MVYYNRSQFYIIIRNNVALLIPRQESKFSHSRARTPKNVSSPDLIVSTGYYSNTNIITSTSYIYNLALNHSLRCLHLWFTLKDQIGNCMASWRMEFSFVSISPQFLAFEIVRELQVILRTFWRSKSILLSNCRLYINITIMDVVWPNFSREHRPTRFSSISL